MRFFDEANEYGGDNTKYLLHTKRWDVFKREKLELTNGGYYMEASGSNVIRRFGKSNKPL